MVININIKKLLLNFRCHNGVTVVSFEKVLTLLERHSEYLERKLYGVGVGTKIIYG
jgi:hypothetical protein